MNVSKMFETSDPQGIIQIRFTVEELIGLITVLNFSKQTYDFLSKQEKETASDISLKRLNNGYDISVALLDRILGETQIGPVPEEQLN